MNELDLLYVNAKINKERLISLFPISYGYLLLYELVDN